jgi:hypothetical protein
MLFEEALTMLKDGKSICRSAWSLDDGYLQIMPGMKYVWKIVLLPQPNAGNFIFSVDDFTADDWQEFSMPCVSEACVVLDQEAA